jgi:hypothetical protein
VSDLTNYDPHAETSVLAACLWSRTARDEARRHLTAADFHDRRNEHVWEAMRDLDRSGGDVDPASLLSALQATHPASAALLPDLLTWPAVADHVGTYAETVRGWAVRRRLYGAAVTVQQRALNPDTPSYDLAARVATEFAAIRDSGSSADAESITFAELLAEADPPPEWLIPGLLERGDRLMLTGEEGLGKSHLLRQLAIMAAAGLDPFDHERHITPCSILIVDCENSERQVRRRVRGVVEFAQANRGRGNVGSINLLCSRRMDITADRDLARIHRELDACQPDLMVIGPLYRLTPRAIQTDDEAAPILAALDTIRDRGIALLIEAHAGHSIGKGGQRDLRPRGSSALLGWPEFGYGMRDIGAGCADMVPWRGDRDERQWPDRLRRDVGGIRWVPVDSSWTP